MAQFAAIQLKVTECFVVDDSDTYGRGLANLFVTESAKQGVTVVGRANWDKSENDYTGVFRTASAAGADCVFLGGTFDQNGSQLIKDKVAVLGDNTRVKLFAPNGFAGNADFDRLSEAQGADVIHSGLPIESLMSAGNIPANFLADYKVKHGADLVNSSSLYGVQALQVILAAIAASDGSRASVRNAVFKVLGWASTRTEPWSARPSGSILALATSIRPSSRSCG